MLSGKMKPINYWMGYRKGWQGKCETAEIKFPTFVPFGTSNSGFREKIPVLYRTRKCLKNFPLQFISLINFIAHKIPS